MSDHATEPLGVVLPVTPAMAGILMLTQILVSLPAAAAPSLVPESTCAGEQLALQCHVIMPSPFGNSASAARSGFVRPFG